MHVGLNLIFLVPGETGGMEVAARALVPALVAARPDWRFTAYVNREAAAARDGPWGELVPSVTVPVNARNRVEWVRGEHQLLPGLARRDGCDLVHSLASTGPARGRFRRVVTIHDLIYHRFPEAHFGLRALGMRVLVPLAAHTAHRVFADSRSTRDDIVEVLRVAPGKIDVVPLAAKPATAAPTGDGELRARLGLDDRPIVLSTSAKRPHKNLARLLEAHALLPVPRPQLVLPGYPTEHERQLRERADALGTSGDVRFLGWISAGDLEGLYATAACFVFPSLYEGFGLPVLEAMQRGVPVACSGRTSLAEVAGDAARLFDAENPRAIADALRAVLDDPAEADRLRGAGIAQAARFSWDRTAEQYLAGYERAMSSAGSRA